MYLKKSGIVKIGIHSSVFLFLFVLNTQAQNKTLRYENAIYEPYIKTVQLFPAVGQQRSPSESLNPPVVALNDASPLLLSFDCLSKGFLSFRAKIIHCNADWTPSVLNEIEFLPEYNDFPIQNYHNSFATKIPYYHYTFEVPKTRISGNYILMVYRNRDESDIVLTRRFMVYQNRVNVGGNIRFANNADKRNSYVQVNMSLSYNGYDVINPKEDFKVVVRQNFRDDKTLKNLKPFMVNDFDKKIDYQFFEGENLIPGGNEFRMFDARSTQQKLVNISTIMQEEQQSIIFLHYDKPQNGLAYVATNDFNGMYVIDNYETNRGETESDYVQIRFQLKMDEISGKKVFINGGFNDWYLNDNNLMTYNPDHQAYEASIKLKQGVYNYNYATLGSDGLKNETELEGSHSQTENIYEILVYNRPIGARADALIGYVTIH